MTDTHIKIKPVVPKVQYTGNGVTTDFPYTFAIFDDSDMVVYLEDEIIETGYSVTGAGETDGGYVVFDTAPEDGVKITLLREVPIERMTDFQEGGVFRAKNINDDLDRQTAFVQQLQEKISRAMVVPPTSDVSPETVLMEVSRIYDSVDNIDALADDKTNLDSIANDLETLNSVANNITNIDNVASNIGNVNTVSSIASNVSTVAANSEDVSTCATNMPAILDAPNQASAAASSAAAAAESASLYTTKLNIDMTNATAGTKSAITGYNCPDYSAGISCSALASANTEFDAPSNGIIVVFGRTNAQYAPYDIFSINNVVTPYKIGTDSQWVGNRVSITIPVSKNDKVKGSATLNDFDGAFYPMKGSE